MAVDELNLVGGLGNESVIAGHMTQQLETDNEVKAKLETLIIDADNINQTAVDNVALTGLLAAGANRTSEIEFTRVNQTSIKKLNFISNSNVKEADPGDNDSENLDVMEMGPLSARLNNKIQNVDVKFSQFVQKEGDDGSIKSEAISYYPGTL